jgi:hypothetical protein
MRCPTPVTQASLTDLRGMLAEVCRDFEVHLLEFDDVRTTTCTF